MAYTTVTETRYKNRPEKYEQKKVVFRTYQIIWFVLGFIEALLAFRFVLKALGANPLSGFASLIYALSAPFAAPFLNLFPASASGRVIVEWSTVFAMIVYLLLAYGLIRLLQFMKPTNPEEVERTVDTSV